MNSNVTFDREMGFRYFTKGDGNLYLTQPTGKIGEDGKPEMHDVIVSQNQIDAQSALTLQEYKLVDSVITEEANNEDRITTWMRGLGSKVVEKFDGMKRKVYWYQRKTGETVSRSTMDLEDASPLTSFKFEEDGVPLPLEFGDWSTNIRRDPTASTSLGYDVPAEKARLTAQGVVKGNDLRQLNGWGGLMYRGMKVYGWRDVPTTLTVAQKGNAGTSGWLSGSVATAKEIYEDIAKMVKLANQNGIDGPYVLMLPNSLRFRLAEAYSINNVTNVEKTLWDKLHERPAKDVPNILDIAQVKLFKEMDETKGGGTPSNGEAYLTSINPKWFRVLYYLPMQSFVIDLKGSITTKHRVVEGICPLFKKDMAGNYGVIKLTAPATT